MEQKKTVGTDVNSLEHPEVQWDTTSAADHEKGPQGIVAILLKIGMEQERIIAEIKSALDAKNDQKVIELAKELVYGKK